MTHWQDLLSEYPHTRLDNGGLQFSNQPPETQNVQLVPRSDLAVLRATAGDWRKMLQGQTTCDLAELSEENSVPGALCTPKGRVIANFRLLQDGDDVLLIVPRGAANRLFEALKKFAPFFKVTLEMVEQPLLVTLAQPDSIAEALAMLGCNAELETDEVISWSHGKLIAVSEKQALLTLQEPCDAAWQALTTLAAPSDTAVAVLADIRDGLAWVDEKTTEEFVPQMLALHHTGAVSFKKGCYTGQEVVARMHYLGKLKRQLYRRHLQLEESPAAGTPCHLPGAQQNCGHVVVSTAAPAGGVEALLVLTDEGAASPFLRFGADNDETAVSSLPLPFAENTA